MKINFFKMQAQGNDYLYIDELAQLPQNVSELARKMSDRHFGVGADGIVFILPSTTSAARMCIYNADGGEALMCGSALSSCIAYLAQRDNISALTNISIETSAGVRYGQVIDTQDNLPLVEANMGKAVLDKSEFLVPTTNIKGIKADVGNPHFVIFCNSTSAEKTRQIGENLQTNPAFTNGVNVEFAQVKNPGEVAVNVYERGSGITLACGTGACAVVAAGNMLDVLANDVNVRMTGGLVHVRIDKQQDIYLSGSVQMVFYGTYTWNDKTR